MKSDTFNPDNHVPTNLAIQNAYKAGFNEAIDKVEKYLRREICPNEKSIAIKQVLEIIRTQRVLAADELYKLKLK